VADRPDVLELELEANRAVQLRREEIQDPAARGHLAALLDQRAVVVARGDEHVEQRIAVAGHAALEVGDPAPELAAGRHPPEQCGPRRHEGERGLAIGRQELVEQAHAARLEVGMRREAVEGGCVVARQQAGFVTRRKGLEVAREPFCALRGRRHDQDRTGMGIPQARHEEGARAAPDPKQPQCPLPFEHPICELRQPQVRVSFSKTHERPPSR
jgi:hypothetical protein